MLNSLMLQIVVVVLVARGLALALRRLGQSVVIAEMAAGFLLGPAVLGAALPAVHAAIFPRASLAGLSALGDVGLTLFMLVIGAEIGTTERRRAARRRAVALVGVLSLAVPATLALLAAPLLRPLAGAGVQDGPFAAFLALALATSAVPVMARILKDRRQSDSEAGAIALGASGVGDVAVWTALPLIVGYAAARADLGSAALRLGGLLALGAFGWLVARPLLARHLPALMARRPPAGVGVAIVGGLGFAAATSALGLHAVFGAFLFGLCLPRAPAVRSRLEDAVLPLATLVLMPCFFAAAGLGTTAHGLALGLAPFALVFALAVGGKLLGGFLGARLAGCGGATGLRVAVLVNTRGMMELVVIKLGLDTGLVGPDLFTVLFAMAIATTAMTGPLLDRLDRAERREAGTSSALSLP
jgi:Kef-type K+ transport system membrane component KefB